MNWEKSVEIIISRMKFHFGKSNIYGVGLWVGGEKLGIIWNGQKKSFFTSPGEKNISIKWWALGKREISLKTNYLPYGSTIYLECGNKFNFRKNAQYYLHVDKIVHASKKKIFISYRRDDTDVLASRIYAELIKEFGMINIFKDSISIRPGENFMHRIEDELRKCSVLLVIIGKNWSMLKKKDNEIDYVEEEIKMALSKKIPIIPILEEKAVKITRKDLSEELGEMLNFQMLNIRNDLPFFLDDINKLFDGIKFYFKKEKNNSNFEWLCCMNNYK